MNKINIGVFPCGSEVGLEINKALKYYRHFNLIGLNSVEDHGRICYNKYIGNIPFVGSEEFLKRVKKVIKENKIRFLIPAMDEAGYFLKKNEAVLDCEVVYPRIEISKVLRKKTETYQELSGVVPTPEIYNLNSINENLPIFAKPDIGYGSRGAKIINDPNDPVLKSSGYIFSELLPGEEFTIDCFTSKSGELIYSNPRKRSRIRMGISVSTENVEVSRFIEFASAINDKLKFQGLWFFQMKEDKNGNLKLLEVAGRVSGSMALNRGLGVNLIAMDIFQRLGNTVHASKILNQKIVLERSFDCKIVAELNYRNIYCDFDDCLILDDKVNTSLLQFLYQGINKRKKLILITRHDKDIHESLKKFRLNNIFDNIIHITNPEVSKASKIESKESIFIDDSFIEREVVFKAHKIPCFAPDVIDMLIDKSVC
ncbi:MAG: ATP-grasp domain-containing protein [Balneola sp.]